MEQLKIHDGHMGKLARLIRKDRKFVSRIKRIAVDEAHTIYTAGIPKHNKPAYRPAYGYFDTIRLLFCKSTSVIALSATLPKHILSKQFAAKTIHLTRPPFFFFFYPSIK